MSIVEGTQLKEEGMARAAARRKELLTDVRNYLTKLAFLRMSHEVTADDARHYMAVNHPTETLGNAAGSIFKGGDFEFTGNWVFSEHDTNHARAIRVWRLRK